MALKQLAALLASTLTLGACSKLDILNMMVPQDGYRLHSDIAYGDGPRQHLDIYVPDHPAATKDVILFFYGGSWQRGDKADYRFIGQAFASKGYTTVIADYSLYPQARFPAFVEDGAAALAWVHNHIAGYGGDASRVFLCGHSAGGYIAIMLATNDAYIKAAGGSRAWIRGAIGIAGPYDFLPFTDPKIIDTFSTAPDVQTQPITFVGEGMPPMLLATGDADDEVGAKNARNLAAKLRKYHNNVTERIYPGIGHIGIVLSLASGFRSKAPLLDDIAEFIDAQ